MKTRTDVWSGSLFVLIVLMTIVPSAAFASAVLLDVRGTVNVKLPGGKSPQAKAGMELPDGSILAVKSGGRAQVLLQSGTLEEVASGKSYTVGANAGGSKRTTLGSGIAVAVRELSQRGSGPTVHGMVKEAEGPRSQLQQMTFGASASVRGIFPVATSLRTNTVLSFRISAPLPAVWRSPVLVVEDARKQQLLVKAVEPGKREVALRSGELPLVPGGKYSWYLGVREGGRVQAKSARYDFSILSTAEEQSLSRELAEVQSLDMGAEGKAILSAAVFQRYQLYGEVVRELAPFAQGINTVDAAKRMLLTAYARMGDSEEAQKYR